MGDGDLSKSPLVTCTMLVKIPSPDSPQIISQEPETFDISNFRVSFESSCIPCSSNLSKQAFFFAFNVERYYCYTLYWWDEDCAWEIILFSCFPFAVFFRRFLKLAFLEFLKENSVSEPILRYHYILSLIQAWPQCFKQEFEVMLPTLDYTYQFTEMSFSYGDFDPSQVFTKEESEEILKYLIASEPILFITPNAEFATHAIYCALSLIAPLQYRERIVLWLRETDPRFVKIVEGTSSVKLAATSCEALGTGTGYFHGIFYVNALKANIKNSFKEDFHTKISRSLMILDHELDQLLISEPYSDVIELPPISPYFPNTLKYYRNYDMLTYDDFLSFTKTNTFRFWRKLRAKKGKIRDSLIGSDMGTIFQHRSKEDLLKINEAIRSFQELFSSDQHAVAVLKKHKKKVVELLSSIEDNSSTSKI